MTINNYLTTKVSGSSYKRANIVDLINKARAEQRKEKRNTIIYAAGAVSLLVISGLIISL